MGASQIKCQPPKLKEFQLLNYGYCTVWKRKSDQVQLMEQYDIEINTIEKLNLYKSLWSIRTKNPLLVSIYYFTHQTSKMLCGSLQSGSIFTQRIFYRLSQFSNINYEQGMSILKICFSAYKILYSTSGLFLIRSTMIGFNEQMKIKVWHHTDFSQAQPQNPNCNSPIQMISSIIQCVQRNLQFPYNFPKFSQFLSDKTFYLTNFSQIQIALYQYLKIYQIQTKETSSNIKSYLRRAQGWQIFAVKSQYQRYQQLESQQRQSIRRSSNPMSQMKRFSSHNQAQQERAQDILSKTIKKPYFTNAYFEASSLNRSSKHSNSQFFQFSRLKKSPKTRINKPESYINLKFKDQEHQALRIRQSNQRKSKSQQIYPMKFNSKIQQNTAIRPKFIRPSPPVNNLNFIDQKTKRLVIQNEYYNSSTNINKHQNHQSHKHKSKKINGQSFLSPKNIQQINATEKYNCNSNSAVANNNRGSVFQYYGAKNKDFKQLQIQSSISLIEDLQAKYRVKKIISRGLGQRQHSNFKH